MDVKVYNTEGKETGTYTVPEGVFALPWNADLVHQVVTSMEGNARTPVAHTKGRGEVRGGGKKPWRQKGTGRARHGSIRSPIWRGGGVAHGPRAEKNFKRKINKKMKIKALYTVLSRKMKEGEVIFLDNISLGASKTKRAKEVLSSISKIPGLEKMLARRQNAAYIAVPARTEELRRSFGNIGNVLVEDVKNLNPLVSLKYRYLIIANPDKSVRVIADRYEKARA